MLMSQGTSLNLLSRLREGDPESWRRMNCIYRPLMRAWLRPRGLQHADIDDITQTALAVVLRRLADFRHNGRVGAFRAWLHAIVINVLRDHVRAAHHSPAVAERFLADIEDPHSELYHMWDADHDRYVLSGLMELVRPEFTPVSWDAFRRTVLEGQNTAVVAVELGLTPNAVRIARSRILARLREEGEGFVEVT